jgi:long-chain acyl-CoA synthetase
MFKWWPQRSAGSNGGSNGNGYTNGRRNGTGSAHDGHAEDETESSLVGSDDADTPPTPPEQPLEQPWLAQLDREGIPRTLRYPTTTLARILDQTADRFAELPALLYGEKSWTYRELLARVNRMAGGLSRLGVRKGDRVVLALPNCPEYVISFFAAQKLGAVVVNAGPLIGADDLRTIIALTNPRVVIGLDLQAQKIVTAAKDSSTDHFVWVTLQSYQTFLKKFGYQFKLWQEGREHTNGSHGPNGNPAHHTSLADLLKHAPAKPPTVEPPAGAMAVLQPTSGTTGTVKLAQLSHRNLLANATQVANFMGGREGQERVLAVLPMFHIYGLMTGLLHPVLSASTVILVTRFEAAQTLDVLVRDRPTIFPLVPAICDALSNEIQRRDPRPKITGLRICISGAAPLPIEVAQRFERLTGGRVVEGYGMSESSPVTHANPPDHPRYGSIGLPMPDTSCRIVDLERGERDVPVGQPGELLISGPQVMSGYFGNPDETQRALWIDPQGRTWLRTGDVVRMDEDGFFQVLDRKKDMIIRSGLKVYPAKVERVLLTHSRIADAAVIGRAHPIHTEEVLAFIVLKADDVEREKLVEELRGLCREHLAPYEVPAKFEFAERIPRSALGKLLKKELRKLPEPAPAVPAHVEKSKDTNKEEQVA